MSYLDNWYEVTSLDVRSVSGSSALFVENTMMPSTARLPSMVLLHDANHAPKPSSPLSGSQNVVGLNSRQSNETILGCALHGWDTNNDEVPHAFGPIVHTSLPNEGIPRGPSTQPSTVPVRPE